MRKFEVIGNGSTSLPGFIFQFESQIALNSRERLDELRPVHFFQ